MEKVKEGGKAGVIAGIIYAIMTTIVVAALEYAFKTSIMKAVSSELPSGTRVNINALYDLTVEGSIVVAVIFGIILGLVLGLIFGAVSDRIPGKSGIAKGVVFGFLLWLVLHVLADSLNLKYGATFYFTDISLGLATSLFYGVLLGKFFERGMNSLAPKLSRL